jgi:sucrose phosphorylase
VSVPDALTVDSGANACNGCWRREPRPGLPFTSITLADGSRRILWTTFTAEQIDIDVMHPRGIEHLEDVLCVLASNGIAAVRLDAVGYAVKTAGSSCFMTNDTFEFIRSFTDRAKQYGLEVLVEVHAYHGKRIEIAGQVDWVYDFALPPLVLHAFFNGTARHLKRWIGMRPPNALTVLDTHDGIGMIDVAADEHAVRRIRGSSRKTSWPAWPSGFTRTATARTCAPPAPRQPISTYTK